MQSKDMLSIIACDDFTEAEIESMFFSNDDLMEIMVKFIITSTIETFIFAEVSKEMEKVIDKLDKFHNL